MRSAYSAAQIRAAERPLLEAGVPLMARAAAGLAEVLRTLMEGSARGRRIVVLVGTGDNGGDALFAAATLADDGADVVLIPTGSRIHEAGLAAARAAGAAESAPDAAARLVADAAILVDGILGTGTSGDPALRGPARELVLGLLPLVGGASSPVVVAVDLPSGIGPDDGRVPHPAVLPADVTVTFGAVKAGLLIEPARSLAGRVILIDIGLGPQLADIEPVLQVADD
jgi:NAD(P)H-hydrate epimerase